MKLCALFLVFALLPGCGWKPKPYVRDPMGRLPLQIPEAATVEPLTPVWPAAPEPPVIISAVSRPAP